MGTKQIRELIFSFLIAITIPVSIFVDYCCVYDPTIIIYSVICATSLICFLLYVIWWYKKGGASNIYATITLLFLATFITNSLNLLARVYYVYDKSDLIVKLFDSILWKYRSIPNLIIMLYLLSFTLARIISNDNDDNGD